MVKLLILYLHLIATCVAVGSIVATDLRLVSRLRTPGFRFAPPNRFVTQLVGGSLILLWLSGACLVAFGVGERPDFLNNPKLQGKLLLVAALTLNAAALHLHVFPSLQRGRRIDWARPRDSLGIALPIAASNVLWLYCAFLGVARPWNHAVPLTYVLSVAGLLTALAWVAVLLVIALTATTGSASSVRTHARRRVVRPTPTAPGEREEFSPPSGVTLRTHSRARRGQPSTKDSPHCLPH